MKKIKQEEEHDLIPLNRVKKERNDTPVITDSLTSLAATHSNNVNEEDDP